MADSSITGLSSAGTIAGTEVLPVDQSGSTKKVAVADLAPGLPAVVGDSGSGGTKGLVPAPAAGDAAAGKFLKADGTFAVPSGASTTLTTKGDVLTYASGLARLAVGSDGQVLTADSAQTAGIKWASSSAGGFVKIAQVITSGSAATITFSSIPGTYTGLKLVVCGRDTATGSGQLAVRIALNGDTTSGNYEAAQGIDGSNTTINASTAAASSAGGVIGQIPGTSGNANAFGVIDALIPLYAGTTFYKMGQSVSSIYRNASPGVIDIGIRTMVWKSTSAIASMTLTAGGTAFLDGTTATLYGIG